MEASGWHSEAAAVRGSLEDLAGTAPGEAVVQRGEMFWALDAITGDHRADPALAQAAANVSVQSGGA